MSKKVTLSADQASATVADATLGDTISTLFDSTSSLTGLYKYVQLGLVGVGTAMFMNNRHTGSFLNFGSGR